LKTKRLKIGKDDREILFTLTDAYRPRVDKRMISFYKSLTPPWVNIEEGESG